MKLPRMQFEGLMTFPTAKPETRQYLERALQLLKGAGVAVPIISGGGSPSIGSVGDFPMLTEYRAGTYIYNDVMQVTAGAATWDDCAMTVRATVVSRPTEDRAVLDTGSKVLTYDQYFAKGFGRIVEYPDAQITGFSEEHGIVDISKSANKPKVGEVVNVIPNHCCVVTNMMDEIYGVRRQGRGGVAGRGARQGALVEPLVPARIVRPFVIQETRARTITRGLGFRVREPCAGMTMALRFGTTPNASLEPLRIVRPHLRIDNARRALPIQRSQHLCRRDLRHVERVSTVTPAVCGLASTLSNCSSGWSGGGGSSPTRRGRRRRSSSI